MSDAVLIYLKVAFWLGVAGVVIRFFTLMVVTEWPRNRQETIGECLALLVLGVCLTLWVGYLIWGQS